MINNGIHVGGDMSGNHNVVNNPPPAPAPVPGDRRDQRRTAVDVLVIAALKEEFDAVKAVAGLSQWQDHDDPAPYSTIGYRTGGGRTISVALARPTHMGGRNTGPTATLLTEELRPTCLAMCGVCAGNPTSTTPGDVIVASPAYEWDEGKHTGGVFRADPQQFPQDNRWIRAAQEFDPSRLPSYGTATDTEATTWYLERLYKEQDPRTHPARERYFPPATWGARLERLESDGLITWQDAGWVLTEAGRNRIQRTLYIDVDAPKRLPFAVFVGPMASGSAVMSEPAIWDRLGVSQRSLLALEMEAATIATIAHQLQVPHWLVAKGVMDHADLDKDDRFKSFAARASAEVLLALLGDMLAPAAASPRPATPPREIPGAVQLEVVRRLTYDWQDLADFVGVPPYEMRRFRAGDEPRELWTWLGKRNRLPDLPGALEHIGRADLAALLRPYV